MQNSYHGRVFVGTERSPNHTTPKGVRQFLDPEQQRAWMEGEAIDVTATEM